MSGVLPSPHDPSAPRFDIFNPSTLHSFFRDLLELYSRAGITDNYDMKRRLRFYIPSDVADIWAMLSEYWDPMATFSDFKSRVLSLYSDAGSSPPTLPPKSRLLPRKAPSDRQRCPPHCTIHPPPIRPLVSVFQTSKQSRATPSALEQRLRALEQQILELRRATTSRRPVYVAPVYSSYRRTVLGPERAAAPHFKENSRDLAVCHSSPSTPLPPPPIASSAFPTFLPSRPTSLRSTLLPTSRILPANAFHCSIIVPHPPTASAPSKIVSPSPATLPHTPATFPIAPCDFL